MKIIASDTTGDPTVIEINGMTFTRAPSTPSPDADRVRIAVAALEVARANAERGGKAPGVEEWRAQSMCRNVVALIDKALAALKAAALSPAPEDKEAGRG